VTSTRIECGPAVRVMSPFWVGSRIGVKLTTGLSSIQTWT
jgi:hypothetical protein